MSQQDTPELEQLFDQYSNTKLSNVNNINTNNSTNNSNESNEVYKRIGSLARKLHDELKEVKKCDFFTKASQTLPNSKERLSFIGKLMEQSANKTLNLCEKQIADAEAICSNNDQLEDLWTKASKGLISKEEFMHNIALLPEQIKIRNQYAQNSKSAFLEIVMAQDFQDLAGQNILRLIKSVAEIEKDLIELLALAEINEQNKEKIEEFLAGPQINETDPNSVHSQAEVDDLLKDLGF